MANLSVTEYTGLAVSQPASNGVTPAVLEPAVTRQLLAYTSATSTVAFATNTRFIRIASTADLYYEIGTEATATAGSTLLPQGQVEVIGIAGGDLLSAYDGTT